MPEFTALANEGIGPQCYWVDANLCTGEDFATAYGTRDIVLLRTKRHSGEFALAFSNGVVDADDVDNGVFDSLPVPSFILNKTGTASESESVFMVCNTGGGAIRSITTNGTPVAGN